MASDAEAERIDYPQMVREALIQVVRRVLERVAEHGLPGDHHFYLTFRTAAPGVELPAALRQQFPEEMTIVLQHQYWGLEVEERRFRVTLRFGGTPHALVVPFEALTTFVDPSASFGLRLEEEAAPAAAAAEPQKADGSEPAGAPSIAPSLPGGGNVVAFRRPKGD